MSPFATRLIPDATMVERFVHRVRGGFLGRWWVREVSYRPARHVLTDERRSVIIAHPEVIEQLRAIAQPR